MRLDNAMGVVICRFLLATPVQAKVIQGTVTDASTGEPLPAATVHVLGAYDGTISNTEGKYVLTLRSLPVVPPCPPTFQYPLPGIVT